MKFSTAFLLGATALAGAASFSGTAQAGPSIPFASGSIAFQATTNTTSTLATTTSFFLSSGTNLVSGANDFSGAPVSNPISGFGGGISTINLNDSTSFSFN